MTRFKPTPGARPRPAPSALETLYRNTSTWLVARLRRRFGETLAEDIAQEAYLRMSRIDMDEVRHPKALLLKVAVNAGLSQTRRAASRGRVANLAVECDAAEIDAPCPSEQDEAQLLKEIILGLPPLYRDVFLLSQFAGMPNDPAAIRAMVAVAAHRGWATVSVRGDKDFSREVWREARRRGIEVRGYAPTPRDLEAEAKRDQTRSKQRRPAPAPTKPMSAERREAIVEAVVAARMLDPERARRLLDAARARMTPIVALARGGRDRTRSADNAARDR